MSVISMKQLLEAGVHFGHQTRRWNPKMAPYIYTERNGIYIIDLQKTVKKLEEAYSFVRNLAENGQTILFVGTKKQAADAVKPLVLEANTKVLAFVDMPLDPYYESSKLKDTTDGVYTDVFDGFSYGDYDAEEAAEILLDGVSGVLSANA